MRHTRLCSAAWCLLGSLAQGNFHVATAATTTPTPTAPGETYAEVCAAACRKTFITLKFADVPTGAFFAMQECTSRLHQQSLYLCWDRYCTQDMRLAEARRANQTCEDVYGVVMPPHSIVDGLTNEEISLLKRFNATSPDRASRFSVPMLPSPDFHHLWAKTLDAHDYVYFYHYYYGWAMGVFWAWVVACGIANRTLVYLDAHSLRSTPTCRNKAFLWFKRHILTPATFGQRSVQDFGGWGTLPPRIQTLTVMLFVLMNVVCTVHGYRIFSGYVYYPSIGMQVLRHVSDRTGIISFANFPLIWLFGMRNNVIIWLTGWEFKTYNSFHRWVARVATVQAIIHSVGYTVLILEKGGRDYFWRMCNMTYWWTGELATIFMSALVLLSAFWLRRRYYEFFLVSHIVLSALVLAAMLGHVSIYGGQYDALALAAVAIWLLDRFVRIVRILSFNLLFWNDNARVTYNKETRMIRVIVSATSSLYHVKPGTFYYIMVLNKWKFWESHPFTVAVVPSRGRHQDTHAADALPLLHHENICGTSESNSEYLPYTQEMTFLIRPYDSFTARLKEHAESTWPGEATLCVALDGPYGETLPLHRFRKVVFVVGGSGIAVPLSYLEMLTTSPTRLEAVYIHWAVRQPSLAVDILNHELAGISGSDLVHMSVYVTGSDGGDAVNDATGSHGTWTFGRMNIGQVLDDALAGDGSSLAVIASGPGRMADDCRRSVVEKTGNPLFDIEYFEESFQW